MNMNIAIKINIMRKTVFTVLAAASLLCSCAKEAIIPPVSEPEQGEKIKLDISPVDSGHTKVTDITGEGNIDHFYVFVFREDGSLDSWGYSEEDYHTIECSVGEREIFVLANTLAISNIYDIEDLEEERASLQFESLGEFSMVGRKKVSLKASSSVTVPVSRKVARVSIEKIVTDFTLDQFKESDFVLKGIYLTNVAGDAPLIVDGEPWIWHNSMRLDGRFEELTYSGQLSEVLEPGVPYNTVHYFYCYENDAEDSFSVDWCPRHTRLVVEAELAGKTYYYPVTLPVIEANHIYVVTELKITGPGALYPEFPVEYSNATFAIEVLDWEEGFAGAFEI